MKPKNNVRARRINATLRKLGDRVQDITGGLLNYGGCGVYAALVGAALQKLGITTGIVVNGWGSADLGEVRSKVEDVGDVWDWNRNGVDFWHVGVEYVLNGRAYQCDSDHVARRYIPSIDHPYRGRLTVAEMKALTRQQKGWNHTFPRKTIPAIRKAVKEAFAPLMVAA